MPRRRTAGTLLRMSAMFPRLAVTFLLAATLASAANAPRSGAQPSAVAPKSDHRSVEPIGKVDGLSIPRPSGGFLGLQIVNNHFVLSFYNAKQRKTAPDVARATVRWPVKYQPNDDRAVLNPGSDGTSLTSGKTVRPPHTFKVALSLFVEGSEDAVESYSVDYPASADAP